MKQMSRKPIILTAIVGCMLALVAFANAQKKPNVVIMLADNVGYGDVPQIAAALEQIVLDAFAAGATRISFQVSTT